MINKLKQYTKYYYDNYIINLSKPVKEEDPINFISIDIFNFIKKFVKNHNLNLDIDNLNQHLKQDSDNFYKLNIKILNTVSDCNDEIIDNLLFLFKKHKLINSSENDNIEDESKSENYNEEDNGEGIDGIIEKNKFLGQEGNYELSSYEKYLLDGDQLIEENINKKKIGLNAN